MKNRKRTHIYTFSRLVFLTLFIALVSMGQFQLWLLVYIGGVLVSPILGRVYCGYACPMNTIMRPVENISRKLGLQRQRLPRWLENPNLRYVMLVATVSTMVFGRKVLDKEIPILPTLFMISVVLMAQQHLSLQSVAGVGWKIRPLFAYRRGAFMC
jgi:polyferredoxin